MKSELVKLIIDNHRKISQEEIDSSQISFLLYNSRSSDIIFVFIGKEKGPSYILKISNDEQIKKRLKNEYENLSKIIQLRSSILKGSFPQPIDNGLIGGREFILETAGEGLALNEFISASKDSKDKTEEIFSLIMRWLIELHKEAYLEVRPLNDSLFDKNVLDTVSLCRRGQDLSIEEEERINSLSKKMKIMDNIKLPFVLQHRDFSAANILYNKRKKRICVLDWEYSKFLGLPLIDLLNFFIVYKSVITGYENRPGKISYKSISKNIYYPLPSIDDFIGIFYEDNWQSRLVKRYIDEYCKNLSLDKGLLRFIFLLFVLTHLAFKKDFLSIFFEREKSIIFN